MSQTESLAEAIRLFKAGDVDKSRQLLHNHLSTHLGDIEALLWLVRVAPDPREAAAAAELALALQPNNETAQRAVANVYSRPVQARAPKPAVDASRLTGLTVAQARSVKWPFRDHNRPIGVLLDEGVITLRDLAWAAENAREDRLQQAVRTILLAKLLGDNLQEPRPPLKVIEGASYTEYQARIALLWGGLLGGALVTIWVAAFLLAIAGAVMSLTRTPGFGVVTAAVVITMLAVSAISVPGMRWLDTLGDRVDQAKAGGRGEKRVLDALRATLTSPWAVFHDLEWPNRHWGDVDLILVGTGGVWVFEVKALRTPTRNIGDRWQFQTRWGWRKMTNHPGMQARRNARNVKDYLDLHGVRIKWVQPVVIWAGEDSSLTLEDPAIPVWRLSELPERMEALWREQKLTADQVEKCSAILAQVIETAAAKANADMAKVAPKPAAA